jgi:putative tryptophan/tyrosine transport system substrate-binding protein
MALVGIMHSGSQKVDGPNVTTFQTSLTTDYKGVLDYAGTPLYAIDLDTSLPTLAKQLVNAKPPLNVLVAAGGSRSADAAIKARGSAKTPIIVFTSVAPYILSGLDLTTTTGVCAHTSDHDVARLKWLIQMPLPGNRIGVLINSDRGDGNKQIADLRTAAGTPGHNWTVIPRDIKIDTTLKASFDWLHGDIHALLVAADPVFNENRQDVVNRATDEKYPAIFQWREFVELGGLMSYGPTISTLYQQAGRITASILNGTTSPPYQIWEPSELNDFELVVNRSTAQSIKNMWPLPLTVAGFKNLTVI